MARYLVIGSSGFLGAEIVFALKEKGEVIPTHFQHRRHQNSIRYDFFSESIDFLLEKYPIDSVIFAGMVETAPSDQLLHAMERFAQGCKNLRLLYLSSDGIFDGQKGFYSETDIPQPATLYGRNLALCEQIITSVCSNYCIVRPSYIYGFSDGRLDTRLARTREVLERGEAVSLFADMYKSPLGVEQVAQAVIDLAQSSYVGTVHVAGERLSVYDFHLQAMRAMHVNTRSLKSNSMPMQAGFLRDTSLSTSLWQNLTGSKPKSVFETLSATLSLWLSDSKIS